MFHFQVADAGSDYRVDPVIVHNCQDDMHRFCSDELESPRQAGAIYSCLMRNIDSGKMTSKCSESVLQLQYVVSRDFTLDPQLFKRCRKDAMTICHAPSMKWHVGKDASLGKSHCMLDCLFVFFE